MSTTEKSIGHRISMALITVAAVAFGLLYAGAIWHQSIAWWKTLWGWLFG